MSLVVDAPHKDLSDDETWKKFLGQMEIALADAITNADDTSKADAEHYIEMAKQVLAGRGVEVN